MTCVDAARLQRASKGAGQSAGRRGNDIVERRGVRWILAQIGAVVLGYLVVDAKRDWVIPPGHPGIANRTPDPFDLDLRSIHYVV